MLITDEGLKYMKPNHAGGTARVRKSHCNACTHRHRCIIEPQSSQLTSLFIANGLQLFLPEGYQQADFDHAVRSCNQIRTVCCVPGTVGCEGLRSVLGW